MSDQATEMTTETAPVVEDLSELSWESEAEQSAEPEISQEAAAPETEATPPEESSPAQAASSDPDREWFTQADTLIETIGGRELFPEVVDLTQRLFGLSTDGLSFIDKLVAEAPGVYRNLEAQVMARQGDQVTPELRTRVLDELNLTEANLENYRLMDRYGLDAELVNADARQRDLLDTLSPEDRQTFQQAPADIKEEIVEAFERGRATVVQRNLQTERNEQAAKRDASQQSFNSDRDEEVKIGAQTNEVIGTQIDTLNTGYAQSLKLPLTYVEGVMTKALRAMQGTAKDGEGIALHYASLRKAVADKNKWLQNEAVKQLKPFVDSAFRAQLEQEKQQVGDYDFHGFYAPAAPKVAPTTATVPAQFQAEAVNGANGQNPEDADLHKILFGRS